MLNRQLKIAVKVIISTERQTDVIKTVSSRKTFGSHTERVQQRGHCCEKAENTFLEYEDPGHGNIFNAFTLCIMTCQL